MPLCYHRGICRPEEVTYYVFVTVLLSERFVIAVDLCMIEVYTLFVTKVAIMFEGHPIEWVVTFKLVFFTIKLSSWFRVTILYNIFTIITIRIYRSFTKWVNYNVVTLLSPNKIDVTKIFPCHLSFLYCR